ncbi:MaoC family dehydratase [Methylonatrum kenyense]|uniref:MaoC family dehydratase n=1 Tax=Methylonatrum kenyense TaxID=455253 RepID=UPI0020C02DA0|nr:MaoC family dehydratase [Methylonatrum kenyense]MCK8517014.1 MaoC family dehydratase [Methylonatrum kenyense]
MYGGYYFEDLEVGMSVQYGRTVTESDIGAFAGVSGDFNPVHTNEEFASGTRFKGRIAHGMLMGAFISTAVGTRLPGEGSIYVSQNLHFRGPVRSGDTVTVQVAVTDLNPERRFVTLETRALVGGRAVVQGEAVMLVPARP